MWSSRDTDPVTNSVAARQRRFGTPWSLCAQTRRPVTDFAHLASGGYADGRCCGVSVWCDGFISRAAGRDLGPKASISGRSGHGHRGRALVWTASDPIMYIRIEGISGQRWAPIADPWRWARTQRSVGGLGFNVRSLPGRFTHSHDTQRSSLTCERRILPSSDSKVSSAIRRDRPSIPPSRLSSALPSSALVSYSSGLATRSLRCHPAQSHLHPPRPVSFLSSHRIRLFCGSIRFGCRCGYWTSCCPAAC